MLADMYEWKPFEPSIDTADRYTRVLQRRVNETEMTDRMRRLQLGFLLRSLASGRRSANQRNEECRGQARSKVANLRQPLHLSLSKRSFSQEQLSPLTHIELTSLFFAFSNALTVWMSRRGTGSPSHLLSCLSQATKATVRPLRP